MLRIVTDTGSDITREQADSMQIDRVALQTTFEEKVCPMETGADYDLFYKQLAQCDHLPITSRPSPAAYLKVYEEAKKAGDEVLVLCLSSGLSGTYESAVVAKNMIDYNRIHVVDTEKAVMAQRILVDEAVKLRAEGKNAAEIEAVILDLRDRVKVMGVINTLKYLKKGGRIPPAIASLGDMLKIKPVVDMEDKVVKTVGKARGINVGTSMVYKQIEKDGVDPSYPVYFGYTSDIALGQDFMEKTVEKFGFKDAKLYQLCGVVGTHLGTDCFGLAYVSAH